MIDREALKEAVARVIRKSGIDRGWANSGDAERLAQAILSIPAIAEALGQAEEGA